MVDNVKEEPIDDVSETYSYIKQEDPLMDTSAIFKKEDTIHTVIKKELNLDQCYQEQLGHECESCHTNTCTDEHSAVEEIRCGKQVNSLNHSEPVRTNELPSTQLKTEQKVLRESVSDDFITASSKLSKHKVISKSIKKYQSSVCNNKASATSEKLSKGKSTNGENKRNKCDVCNKPFTHRKSLFRHKLIHSDVRKYKCDICNKAFKQPDGLSLHKRIHTGIKKYQCDVCNKAFVHGKSLFRHKLIHSDVRKYKCDICNKAFKQPDVLSQHKRIHTGIKKYQCDVCNKCFTQACSLTRHKFQHSNVKKYKCDIPCT